MEGYDQNKMLTALEQEDKESIGVGGWKGVLVDTKAALDISSRSNGQSL